MKINPVTTQIYPPASRQKASMKHRQEYSGNNSALYYNYAQIPVSFKAVPNISLDLVKKIPLEDRLASILQNFKLGDLVFVGKNLNDCAKNI